MEERVLEEENQDSRIHTGDTAIRSKRHRSVQGQKCGFQERK